MGWPPDELPGVGGRSEKGQSWGLAKGVARPYRSRHLLISGAGPGYPTGPFYLPVPLRIPKGTECGKAMFAPAECFMTQEKPEFL